jgi:hypothetical protein
MTLEEPATDAIAARFYSPRGAELVTAVILLLKCALMQPEPVAEIVFALSAVSSPGQSEQWRDA